ncbi:hypothetical protein B0H13DRAFT_1933797 [Mycena leptocephala]|nr:hypothetical protein B0H13DRAFT_1933797 [Mycena leptocephala]
MAALLSLWRPKDPTNIPYAFIELLKWQRLSDFSLRGILTKGGDIQSYLWAHFPKTLPSFSRTMRELPPSPMVVSVITLLKFRITDTLSSAKNVDAGDTFHLLSTPILPMNRTPAISNATWNTDNPGPSLYHRCVWWDTYNYAASIEEEEFQNWLANVARDRDFDPGWLHDPVARDIFAEHAVKVRADDGSPEILMHLDNIVRGIKNWHPETGVEEENTHDKVEEQPLAVSDAGQEISRPTICGS